MIDTEPLPLPTHTPQVESGPEYDLPEPLEELYSETHALLSRRTPGGDFRQPTQDDLDRASEIALSSAGVIREGLSNEQTFGATMDVIRLFQGTQYQNYHGGAPSESVRYVRDVGSYLVVSNLNIMTTTVDGTDDPEVLETAVAAVNESLCSSSYREDVEGQVAFVTKHLGPLVRSQAQHGESGVMASSLFETALRNASRDGQGELATVAGELAVDDDPDVALAGAGLVATAVTSANIDNEVRKRLQDTVVKDMLQSRGIDYGKASECWGLASGMFSSVYERANLTRIAELEKERTGICKTLFEEFDIINFARWPMDMMIRQYDDRNNADLQYGSIVAAASDAHGTMWMHGQALAGLFRQLDEMEPRAAVRVYETDNKIGMARAWVTAGRRYGPMGFRVVVGHGSEEGVGLGDLKHSTNDPADMKFSKDNSPAEVLTKYDFEEAAPLKHGRTTRRFSTPKCKTVVVSCITGADEGVVQRASEVYPDEEIIAPSLSVSLQELTASRDADGDLDIDVAYGMNRGGEKRRFVGGTVVAAEVVR
jgi:hypothetical protein